jgi:hypothetical protein
MDLNNVFNDFAKAFKKKVDKEYFIRIQLEIYDMENEIWQIDIKNGDIVIYNEDKIVPEEIFVLSKDTLIKLHNNELAPLTAFVQEPNENGDYCALIDWKDKEAKKTFPNSKQAKEKKYKEKSEFLDRLALFFYFFSKEYPTKIIVSKKNGIKIHNVNGVGLLSTGAIHAYFSMNKNDKKDESGYEFSIYVIEGKGIITIDDEEHKIEEKCYYHMPPKNNVFIKNKEEEILEILYLSHY